MNFKLHSCGSARRWHLLASAATWLGAGLLLATSAQAVSPASPPAGLAIANQATVSYKDSGGAVQSTTSNTVVTTISQIGSYAVAPGTTSGTAGTTQTGNSKSAAAGATVYSAYVINNNGNGADDFTIDVTGTISASNFSKIEIFEDDGTGNPLSTTALCTINSGTNASCSLAPVKSIPANGVYKFLVAYTIPATATSGTWNAGSNTATVKVQPKTGTTQLSSYAQYNASTNATAKEWRTDTVNLVTTAAFNVGKAIKAPAVAGPANLSTLLTNGTQSWTTWPVVTSGPAGVAGSKEQYTTFTLAYTNNGAQAGNLYIKDTLPTGLSYVTGTAVSSCSGATALSDAAGAEAVSCNGTPVEFEHASGVIQAVIPAVPAGASGTLSFVVKVAASPTATIGVGSTTNTASFTAGGCAAGATIALCSASTVVSTNSAAYTVVATRGVQLGVIDTTAGTPASASDATTLSALPAGGARMMAFTITNKGNDQDSFNMSALSTGLQAGMNAFPAGATFTWFNSDQQTPLMDTNSDGSVDTGVIAAGASKTIYLQVFVPSNTVLSATAKYEAVAIATSVNDSAAKDASYADVTAVSGGTVDLTSTGTYNSGTNVAGDWGPGPGGAPVLTNSPAAVAGSVVQVPLYITNNGAASATYNLSSGSNSSLSPMPAGWSVAFSSTACATPAVITQRTVANGVTSPVFYACVTTPAAEATRTQAIYIQVVNSTDSTVEDMIYDAVSVVSQTGYAMQLVANGSGNVTKGNSVAYSHIVTNTGANACGAATGYLKVTATLDAAATTAGWTTAIYLDVNNDGVLDSGDTLISDNKLVTGGLTSGLSKQFLVRVYAPGGAAPGDTSSVTVTVSDVDSTGASVRSTPNGCGAQSVTDSTTVTSGNFQVVKSHAMSAGACSATYPSFTQLTQTAKPGDCIYYQIVATNIGATPQSNVSVADAAPNYTTLSATPAVSCTSTGLTGTAVAAGGTAPNVTCGSAANTLAPGGTVTLKYAVQIAN